MPSRFAALSPERVAALQREMLAREDAWPKYGKQYTNVANQYWAKGYGEQESPCGKT